MVNEDRQVASIAELVVAAEGAEDEVAVAVGVPELDAELASEAIEVEGLLWMSLMQRTTMRMKTTRTTRTMHLWVVSYWPRQTPKLTFRLFFFCSTLLL